jgi:hypothetical protein
MVDSGGWPEPRVEQISAIRDSLYLTRKLPTPLQDFTLPLLHLHDKHGWQRGKSKRKRNKLVEIIRVTAHGVSTMWAQAVL